MIDIIFWAKLNTIRIFSKEKFFICGNRIMDYIMHRSETVMKNDESFKKTFENINMDARFLDIYLRKSDFIQPPDIIPISKFTELLRNELKLLEEIEHDRRTTKTNTND